jgi:hypothetical protein
MGGGQFGGGKEEGTEIESIAFVVYCDINFEAI